ncbi:hypothetical protein ACQEWB_09745 [Streptomyces sp. CA-249302]|uniref:hypothetical protein n=1 Tax=Streptomyces sp. CA-249302 TaxID=3240058 RepID=UPI003D8E98B0
MQMRQAELEYEDEAALESEFEGAGEEEYLYEEEGEEEGEEFLGRIAGALGGLLGEGEGESEGEYEGEWEGEYEGEFEEEAFFRRIRSFVRRAAPILRRVARVAAPALGTAVLGPLGGPIANAAIRALGEGEFEEEYLYEEEGEEEFEAEAEEESTRPLTQQEALAEMMAAVAAQAQTEAEAEAMIGAATVTALSARDRAALRRLLPHLVRATCVLTRLLRRQRATRPAVRTVPLIVRRTARVLGARAAAGRPADRRTAARVLAGQTRRVLASPQQTTRALQRNVRAATAVRAAGPAARTRRPYAGGRPRRPGHSALR